VPRLKSKIARAGTLREKYQDLYRRQKLAAKSRMTGTPGERLNARTWRKKTMFDEAIARLRLQLRRHSHAAASTRRRQSKRDSLNRH
jgi:hypothetical protein